MSPKSERRCWLCDRPLGVRVEWHHPVPKSKGGRNTVPVHPICHRAIHQSFTNAELAKLPPEADALFSREAMERFRRWIADT
ncbi:MAG: HNH endonuclease [Sphingobium sp.]